MIAAEKIRAAWQGGPTTNTKQQRPTYTRASAEIQEKSRDLAARRTDYINAVLRSGILKSEEFATFVRLVHYFRPKSRTGAAPSMRAFPGQAELAAECCRSPRTIRNHLTRLSEVGLLFIESRGGGTWTDALGRRRGQCNSYYLMLPDGISLDRSGHDNGGDDDACTGTADPVDVDSNAPDRGDDSSGKKAIRGHMCPGMPGHTGPGTTIRGNLAGHTWQFRNAYVATWLPLMNPSVENPTDQSINPIVVTSGSIDSLLGGAGEKNAPSRNEAVNDAPYPAVPRDQAKEFVIKLLGEGDEARGRRIVKQQIGLQIEAVDGKLRPSTIERAIKQYHEVVARESSLALRHLRVALHLHGTQVKPSDHIPGNVRVVDMEQWRRHALHRRMEARCFEWASEYLIAEGKAMMWGDRVWLPAKDGAIT